MAYYLQEICELLVAAGYFRARIKGLQPFDKVHFVNVDANNQLRFDF